MCDSHGETNLWSHVAAFEFLVLALRWLNTTNSSSATHSGMAARSSNFKCKKGIGDGSATADAFEHESGDHVSLCSVLNDVVPFHIDGSYSPQLYALRPAAYPSSTFPYDTEGQQCTWAQSDTQIFDNKVRRKFFINGCWSHVLRWQLNDIFKYRNIRNLS